MKVLSKTQFSASEIKLIHYSLHLAIETETIKLEQYTTVPDTRYSSGDIKWKVDPEFAQQASRCKNNMSRMQTLIKKIEMNMVKTDE